MFCKTPNTKHENSHGGLTHDRIRRLRQLRRYVLKMDPAAGTSYATIGEITDIEYPVKSGEIPVPNLLSLAMERRPGFADFGPLTFGMRYTPAAYDILVTAFNNGEQTWEIVLPKAPGQSTSGDKFTWKGFLLSMPFKVNKIENNQPIQMDAITVTINGTVTFTQGS